MVYNQLLKLNNCKASSTLNASETKPGVTPGRAAAMVVFYTWDADLVKRFKRWGARLLGATDKCDSTTHTGFNF